MSKKILTIAVLGSPSVFFSYRKARATFLEGFEYQIDHEIYETSEMDYHFYYLPEMTTLNSDNQNTVLIKKWIEIYQPKRLIQVLKEAPLVPEMNLTAELLSLRIPLMILKHSVDLISSAVPLESYGDFFQLPAIHFDSVNQKQIKYLIHQLKTLPLSHFNRTLGSNEAKQLLEKWSVPRIKGSLKINQLLDKPLLALMSSFIFFIVWFLLTKYLLIDGLGQWLKSALFNTYLLGPLSEFNQPLLAPLATGLMIGLSYVVCFIAPLMFSFYLALFFLKDSGLMNKMQRALMPLLKALGLPYESFAWLFYGPSCHLTFLPQIKKLPPSKQTLALFLTLAGIPCFSQSIVIVNVLLAIHWGYGLLFIGFIFAQAALTTWMIKKLLRVTPSLFIQPYLDFAVPQIKNILKNAFDKTIEFCKNLLPYFLVASLLLSVLDASGGLTFLKTMLNPFLYVLDLPEKTADFFVIGFFQREFGAAKLYYLTNQGELTALQALVSLILMTLFYPCFASLILVIKHFGVKKALKLAVFTGVYAYAMALATSIVFRF